MLEIVDQVLEELDGGRAFALVTVVQERGSTPRAAGAQMLVRSDASIAGTIGGGLLEASMIAQTTKVIANARSLLTSMDLSNPSSAPDQMICGGRAEVLIAYVPAGDPVLRAIARRLAHARNTGARRWLLTFFGAEKGQTDVAHCLMSEGEPVVGEAPLPAKDLARLVAKCGIHGIASLPDGRRLHAETIEPPSTAVICGGGHVGHALAPLARSVGFETVVLDDRPEFASGERFPDASRVVVLDAFADAFADVVVDERSYVIIVTRGHAHDLEVLEQALRTPARYIGLMSSASKWQRFQVALAADGFTERDIARVNAPIGLSIGAETPAELAVSIVGQMIRERATPQD